MQLAIITRNINLPFFFKQRKKRRQFGRKFSQKFHLVKNSYASTSTIIWQIVFQFSFFLYLLRRKLVHFSMLFLLCLNVKCVCDCIRCDTLNWLSLTKFWLFFSISLYFSLAFCLLVVVKNIVNEEQKTKKTTRKA